MRRTSLPARTLALTLATTLATTLALVAGAGCAARTRVDAGDVNGVNPNAARFAIFDSDVSIGDVDGDATDDAVTTLQVVVSDRETLCADLAGVNDFYGLGTITAAFTFAIHTALGTSAGATAPIVLTGDGADELVDMGVLVMEDGTVLADTFGDGRATFGIDALDGAELSGDASGSMTLDFSGQAPFDTDVDADGTDDATAIDVAISGTFHRATRCDVLLQ